MSDPRTAFDPNFAADAGRLTDRVNREARMCRADPVRARRLGVSPQQDLFGNNGSVETMGAWLRGAAAALLPVGWRYRIRETDSGGATLQLTAFDAPPKPDAGGRGLFRSA